MDAVWPYVAAILPTILVATLFYFLIKSMLEGDRRERLAQKQYEAEQDRLAAQRGAAGAAGSPAGSGPASGKGNGNRSGNGAGRGSGETPLDPGAGSADNPGNPSTDN